MSFWSGQAYIFLCYLLGNRAGKSTSVPWGQSQQFESRWLQPCPWVRAAARWDLSLPKALPLGVSHRAPVVVDMCEQFRLSCSHRNPFFCQCCRCRHLGTCATSGIALQPCLWLPSTPNTVHAREGGTSVSLGTMGNWKVDVHNIWNYVKRHSIAVRLFYLKSRQQGLEGWFSC